MTRLAAALASVAVISACAAGATRAQSGPVPPATEFSPEPFSGPELLKGKLATQAECAALPTAVWVSIDRQGECIRYYYSAAGGSGAEPVVFFSSDAVSTNGRREVRPQAWYLKASPTQLQSGSAKWSRDLRLPYVLIGRPGTYGSSGHHAERRTQREIALVSAALDAIKARHDFQRLHLAGYAEGGHMAAALLARRADLGCVVLASALVAVRDHFAEFGLATDVTGRTDSIDPLALVGQVEKRPGLRIIVVTDPDDAVISARSQSRYVRALEANGLPVQQILAAARDPQAHELWSEARHIAASCARGTMADALAASYANKEARPLLEADDRPLHTPPALLHGVESSEAQCSALKMALWVRVAGQGYCVRYFASTAGGLHDSAMVFFPGDIGAIQDGQPVLNAPSARVTANAALRSAQRWSRQYGGPYLIVGRIGMYGSSGHHVEHRRSLREVQIVAAALDALEQRLGFKHFHLVGQSGGGHTVAALVQMRADIGCAVMTSGVISVKTRERDLGKVIGTKIKAAYDPVDFIKTMQRQTGRRLIVVSDPADRTVSFRSQREFADQIRSAGFPILHVTAAAGDKLFHGLEAVGHHVTIDCAKGVPDDALVARHQVQSMPHSARSAHRRRAMRRVWRPRFGLNGAQTHRSRSCRSARTRAPRDWALANMHRSTPKANSNILSKFVLRSAPSAITSYGAS